jgi:hypothetical protein
MTWKDFKIWRVWAATSGPASWPGAGSTPAVPPMVISGPALATWL